MDIAPITTTSSGPTRKPSGTADGLEQAFLSEVLKYAGPRESTGQFGGGIGESQFASLLNDAYAQAIAERINLKLFDRGGQNHG